MSILKARGRASSTPMMFARNWSRIAFLAEFFCLRLTLALRWFCAITSE
jgi:hypothetical protein